jgi:hypothetical protein
LPRKALGKELEPDESDKEPIKQCRDKLKDLIRKRDPKLVNEDDEGKSIGF